ILGIFILGFLLGFAPIRWERETGFQVDSTFAFEVEDPLFEAPGEIESVREEIITLLEEAEVEEPEVLIRDANLFSVETPAVTEEEAARDEQLVTEALTAEFETLQATRLPSEEEQETPVATFGPFGIYNPMPQIQLGLDLQGGAHVVLRCLSEAEMTFALAEDAPLVSDAQGEDSTYNAPFTEEQLVLQVTNLLEQETGARPREIQVEVLGGNRLQVTTRPEDQEAAEAQQDAIYEFLLERYPGMDAEKGEMNSVIVDAETADKVKYIIEQRLFSLGEIREPVIQKQGFDRIIVQMPGVRDPERVLDILKSTAQLEFRLIPEKYEPVDLVNYREWKDTESGESVSWDLVRAESSQEFSGSDLKANAKVQSGQTGDWVVAFELQDEQKDDFNEFTRRNIGRIMAIVLDRECKMAPSIRSAIPGSGIIEGNMTAEDASDLKLLLNAGALPVPLEIVENRTVSATLGQDSITRSLNAALIGLIAVMAFMIIYYRLPGLLANVALLLYLVLVIAITAYAEVTLTLPGIAGLILTLGTAVDANIIIFERLKEELWSRKSMRSAVAAGFDRAWTAILDANVTTLLAAAVLYWLGTSLIKGFAIMLFIGVICSLFTAVTVTRWLLTMVAEARWAQKRALYGVGERSEDEETQLA
ncbi:MAG: protein translocase subunit SecD, partial [Armatimonadia bacterium]|nr:protein translocase subunit SecD [Armatimonadia bacterium]